MVLNQIYSNKVKTMLMWFPFLKNAAFGLLCEFIICILLKCITPWKHLTNEDNRTAGGKKVLTSILNRSLFTFAVCLAFLICAESADYSGPVGIYSPHSSIIKRLTSQKLSQTDTLDNSINIAPFCGVHCSNDVPGASFCMGSESGIGYCYGSNFACLWSTGACTTDADCAHYNTASSKLSAGECSPSDDGWKLCACNGGVTPEPTKVPTGAPSVIPFESCPPGWLVYSGKCYLLEPEKKPWETCASYCAAQGASMLCVSSDEEQDFIYSHHLVQEPTRYWLGYNDRASEGLLSWASGCTSSYTNWVSPTPANDEGSDCVAVDMAAGKWYIDYCLNQFACACESAPVISTPICPVGWVVGLYGECLLLQQESVSATTCSDTCASLGATMLCIRDETDNAFIWKLTEGRSVWLGMNRATGPGWVWPEGCDSDFFKWHTGTSEPQDDVYTVLIDGWSSYWADVPDNYASVSCACQTGVPWRPLEGAAVTTSNNITIVPSDPSDFIDVDLTLAAAVATPTSKVFALATFSYRTIDHTSTGDVQLWRNNNPVGGAIMSTIATGNFLEIACTLMHLDDPGEVGSYEYSVRVAGDGEVGFLNSVRQLALITIPGYYQSASKEASSSVGVSSAGGTDWGSWGIAPVTIHITRATDRVLLIARGAFRAIDGDIGYTTFFRDSDNLGNSSHGLQAVIGSLSNQVSNVAMVWLDSPGSAGSYVYDASLRLVAGSTTLSAENELRHVAAIVLPDEMVQSVESFELQNIIPFGWVEIGLNLTVNLASETDQVLLLVNLNVHPTNDTVLTRVLTTIFRDDTNLGDDYRGLLRQRVAADVSATMTHLDAPSTTGSVTYTVKVLCPAHSFTVSHHDGMKRSLIAVRVSDDFGQPTSLPSAQPSSQPSLQPSRQPSRQPTSQPSSSPSTSPTSQPTLEPSNAYTKVCPTGWTAGGDKCYFMSAEDTTWPLCQSQCAANGTTMSCLQSLAEENFLKVRHPTTSEHYWIGLNDRTVEGTLEWQAGCDTAYLNWASLEPDPNPAKNCAAVSFSNDAWLMKDCEETKGCVCEIPHQLSDRTCPEGWVVAADGSCYLLDNWMPMSRSTCHSQCNAQGASMLCLENMTQRDWLWGQRNGRSTWLGLSRQEGQWVWEEGCSSTFTDWDSTADAPDETAGLDYAAMTASGDGSWQNFVDSPENDYNFCACQSGTPWAPWTGVQDTARKPMSLSAASMSGIALDVVTSTTTSQDKVLLTVNLNMVSAAVGTTAKFSIYRNGLNLVTNALQVISPLVGNEYHAVIMTYLDEPGSIGEFEYSVRAQGTGAVSANDVPRQLAAMTVPSYYDSAAASATDAVTLSVLGQWANLNIDCTVTTKRATDRVLLLMNAHYQSNGVGWAEYMISRAGSNIATGLQKVETAVAGYEQTAANIMYLDGPGAVGPITYAGLAKLGGGSTVTISDQLQTRQLIAIVLPAQQTARVTGSTPLYFPFVGAWNSLGLSVQITPLSTSDRVLVVLNLNLDANPTLGVRVTILRGSTNLGDSSTGLQIVRKSGSRMASIVFLDSPGVAGTAVSYSVSARATGPFNVSENNFERRLALHLVSSSLGMPTSLPSSQPSRQPTRQPSSQPSSSPSAAPSNQHMSSCPAGWVVYSDKCYLMKTGDDCTWDQCQQYCAAHNARMLCVEDALQNELLSRAHPSNSDGLWLGLYGEDPTGGYYWQPGCSSSYLPWDVDEPHYTEQCTQSWIQLQISPASVGYWRDVACTDVGACACEVSQKNIAAYAEFLCPVGWTVAEDGGCYYFENVLSHRDDCVATCSGMGADMLCIEDAAQLDFLRNIRAPRSTWVGLSKQSTSSAWQWQSGCASTFAPWDTSTGQPSSGASYMYAMMDSASDPIFSLAARQSSDTAFCGCQQRAPWKAWQGVDGTSEAAVAVSNTEYGPIGLEVRVATTSPGDKILLLANLNMKAAAVSASASFSLFRDGVNMVPSSLQDLSALTATETKPANMFLLDSPGEMGSYRYSVQAKRNVGAGGVIVSNGDFPRQIAAIIVPSYYSSNSTVGVGNSLSIEATEWVSIGLETTVTTRASTDGVLLTLNINFRLTTGHAYVTIFRGDTNIGDSAGGLQNMHGASPDIREAGNLVFVDKPNSVGRVVYSVRVWRWSTSDGFFISDLGSTRQLAAVVLPIKQFSMTLSTSSLIFSSNVWAPFLEKPLSGVDVGNKVLIIATFNIRFSAANQILYATVLRDGVNLGSPLYGIQFVAPARESVHRALTLTFLDDPLVTSKSAVTYAVNILLLGGGSVVISNGSPRQLAVILISDDFAEPTSVPSSTPTRAPTEASGTACLPGWVASYDKCYLLEAPPRDYATCKTHCESKGAAMLCIENTQQSNFVRLRHPSTNNLLYTGFNDIDNEGAFVWNAPACNSSYQPPWAGGSPDNLNGDEDCAGIVLDTGEWSAVDCATSFGCACQTEHAVSAVTCPWGWTVAEDGGCYLFETQVESTWDQCAATCSAQSASMLCIQNSAQNDFIYNLREGRTTWIGLRKETTTFAWQSDCTSTYLNWWSATGEPDAGSPAVAAIADGAGGLWSDEDADGGGTAFCACQTKPNWRPWAATSADSLAEQMLSSFVSTDVIFTVPSMMLAPTDKILLLANVNWEKTANGASSEFILRREGQNSATHKLQRVESSFDGNSQAVSMTFLDNPNAIGDFSYVVEAEGAGKLAASILRQLSAIVIPDYYSSNSALTTSSRTINWEAFANTFMSFTISVTTRVPTDKVLLLANFNQRSSAIACGAHTIFRGDVNLGHVDNGLQLLQSMSATDNAAPATIIFLDSPGTGGPVEYSLRSRLCAAPTILIGYNTQKSQFSAIVVPADQSASAQTSDDLTITQVTWTSLDVDVSIATFRETDQVLVTVSLNYQSNVDPTTARFTVFRDGVNVVGSSNSLQEITLSVAGLNRIATLTYLDSPGSIGLHTYSLQAHVYTGSISTGSGIPRQMALFLISDSFGQPSSRPTMQPSGQPSAQPTRQPSSQPFANPSRQPSSQPSMQPSAQPAATPSSQPSMQPTSHPSAQPFALPTSQPSAQPFGAPSSQPSAQPSYQPSSQPSAQPSLQSSSQPSAQPSSQPTQVPTAQPTRQPTAQPSSQPTTVPTSQPTVRPSTQPSNQPSRQPTNRPSSQPSTTPSAQPSRQPTSQPSSQPSTDPSMRPTCQPSGQPSSAPSRQPTHQPSGQPSNAPSHQPTHQPSRQPSSAPSRQPTHQPSSQPSMQPSQQPSSQPSMLPTTQPSDQPTNQPSSQPSCKPTSQPTDSPSAQPSSLPTEQPSSLPTSQPTLQPSASPTCQPSEDPTTVPTGKPTCQPSSVPSSQPTTGPSAQPSECPSAAPTATPSAQPSRLPSAQPSARPTLQPTTAPSGQPSCMPSTKPSSAPTNQPSAVPSTQPSSRPSPVPTSQPSSTPSTQPSIVPSSQPSAVPSAAPSSMPSSLPSGGPTALPTMQPSSSPSGQPSSVPTVIPSVMPTAQPSQQPTSLPSCQPSAVPSSAPSRQPSAVPSAMPSSVPTNAPTGQPSRQPSDVPSSQPSRLPSSQPSEQPVGMPSAQPTNSPTRQPQSSPSSVPTSWPTMSPVVRMELPAPNISSIYVVRNRTFIDVQVTLAGFQNAMVYCAIFPLPTGSTFHTLTSVNEVVRQNRRGMTTHRVTSFRFSDLSPITLYSVYCITESIDAVRMSFATAQRSHTEVTTACCKMVSVDLAVASIFETKSADQAIVVRYDSLPSQSITVSFAFTPMFAGSTKATTTFPVQLSLTSTSTSRTTSLTVIAGSDGDYQLTAVLGGLSAEEYDVVLSGGGIVRVLDLETEPAVPFLQAAAFSNDGSAVVVSFNVPTNKGGFNSQFPCTTLLSFTGAQVAICAWTDTSKVAIYPVHMAAVDDKERVLGIAQSVTVLPHTIRAACNLANTTRCGTWRTVAHSSVNVTTAAVPTAPVVSISAPKSIGGCNSLLIDLTASTGSAGRPWKSVIFSVLTTPSSTTARSKLMTFFQRNYTLSPPTVIPSEVLQARVTYSIQATLCNFLGACGEAVATVHVSPSLLLRPTAGILGNAVRSIRRRDALVLNSNSFTQSCSQVVSYANLRSEWTVREVTPAGQYLPVSNARSLSQNPTVFRLAAFALKVNAQYEITLNVTSLVSFESARASVLVSVSQANIVAVIAGGSPKAFKVGEQFTLDASRSQDEDVLGLTGVAAGLKFAWSCVQTLPAFSPSCMFTLPAASDVTQETVRITAGAGTANTQSRVTVTVFDSVRATSAFVDVRITETENPVLGIASTLASLTNINVNENLVLLGSLKLVSACTAVWSVNDASVKLSAALTPTSKPLVPEPRVHTFNLLLGSGALPQRATLQFYLSCGAAQTSITVTTNGAPLRGQFLLSPLSGEELFTLFRFSAVQWTDPDIPLTYQFGFESATSLSNLVIVSKSEFSYCSSTLPAGVAESGNRLNTSLEVFDTLGASTPVKTAISVTKASTASQQQSVLALIDSNTGSVDDTKRVLSVATSVINAVNCTLAPNCTALNRQQCLTTDQSCGACTDGYVGDVGDQNTPCMPYSALNSTSTAVQRCESQDQCNSWQDCDMGSLTCATKPKSCFGNCSSNGVCIYTSISLGERLRSDKCRIDNLFCTASCSCLPGYSGRYCEISDDNLKLRRAVRSKLITSLQNLTEVDDITSQSMSSWSASLYSLSLNPFELSESDAANIVSIANKTLQNALRLGVSSFDSIKGVLQATDTVSSVRRYNYNPNDYNSASFNSSFEYQNNTADDIIPVLSLFSQLVTDSMVLGQRPVSYFYDNFRMTSELHAFSAGGSNISVSSPQTVFEQQVNALPSSAVLVPSAGASVNTGAQVKVNVITVFPRAYSPDTSRFDSDPIYLQVSTTTGQAASTLLSSMQFTLQHNNVRTEQFIRDSVGYNLTSRCLGLGANEVYTPVCPDSGQVLTHNCSGRVGNLTSACPTLQSVCAKLDAVNADLTPLRTCAVLSTNASATVCNCVLNGSPLAGSSTAAGIYSYDRPEWSALRKLTDEDEVLDQSGVANVVATAVHVGVSFAETFNAADSFTTADAFVQVLVVVYLFAAVWGAGFLFLAACCMKSNPSLRKTVSKAMSRKVQAANIASDSTHNESASRVFQEYIESVIPPVFADGKSQLNRAMSELFAHHRYMTLFTLSDGKATLLSKIIVLMKVLTVETMQIFLLAVFYDLESPDDDGSCVEHITEQSCLRRQAITDSSSTYCQWQYNEQQSGYVCEYATPDSSMETFVYIMVFTSIIISISNIPMDYLFQICSAPLISESQSAQVSKTSTMSAAMSASAATVARNARRVSAVAGEVAQNVRRQSAAALNYVAPKGETSGLFGFLSRKENVATVIANREISDDTRFAHANAVALLPRLSVRAETIQRTKQESADLVKSYAFNKRGSFAQSITNLSVDSSELEDRMSRKAETVTDADVENPSLLRSELGVLCEEIVAQRMLLSSTAANTALFDAQWGVEKISPDRTRVETGETPVLGYIVSVQAREAIKADIVESSEMAAELKDKLSSYTLHHAGLAVLHLFLQDILGRRTVAAKIFENKFEEDFAQTAAVNLTRKVLAVGAIIGCNAFFVYYTLLKAYQKGKEWQNDFLLACIVQIIIEMVLNETVECVWLNYCVPSLVSKEVKRATIILRNVAEELTGEDVKGAKHRFFLNAPSYLFSSTKVAQDHPKLLESVVVLSYQTHLPGELSTTWPHYQETLSKERRDEQRKLAQAQGLSKLKRRLLKLIVGVSTSTVLMLKWLGTFNFNYQRIIIRFVQPLLFTALTLLCFFSASNTAALCAVVIGSAAVLAALAWQHHLFHIQRQKEASSIVPLAQEVDAETEKDILNYQKKLADKPASSAGSSSDNEQVDVENAHPTNGNNVPFSPDGADDLRPPEKTGTSSADADSDHPHPHRGNDQSAPRRHEYLASSPSQSGNSTGQHNEDGDDDISGSVCEDYDTPLHLPKVCTTRAGASCSVPSSVAEISHADGDSQQEEEDGNDDTGGYRSSEDSDFSLGISLLDSENDGDNEGGDSGPGADEEVEEEVEDEVVVSSESEGAEFEEFGDDEEFLGSEHTASADEE